VVRPFGHFSYKWCRPYPREDSRPRAAGRQQTATAGIAGPRTAAPLRRLVAAALRTHSLRSALSVRDHRPFGRRGGTLASFFCLICRVGPRACALPIEHVREVMRPCRVDRVEAAPAYLTGVGVIRGETVPVLDAALLLGAEASPVTRFVVLRVGERRVALAVSEVVGTRALDMQELGELPPLLGGCRELCARLGVLDGRLLEVLESGRLLDVAVAGMALDTPPAAGSAVPS
jgi:purine-binding chemotaxis protein CheW